VTVTLLRDDVRRAARSLPVERFQAVVTSVPYWMQRVYLPPGHTEAHLEIGRESMPSLFIEALADVFDLLRPALRVDGTLWINIGSKRASRGSSRRPAGGRGIRQERHDRLVERTAVEGWRHKELIPLPWLLGLELHRRGWWLKAENIWEKINGLPDGRVSDRTTTVHEHVLLLSRSGDCYFDQDAVREPHRQRPQRRPHGKAPVRRPGQPAQTFSQSRRNEPGVDGNPQGKNLTSVWRIATEPSDGLHAAPMPCALARRCILAATAVGDHVLDPFGGSGTVARVAEQEGRHAAVIDIDERAIELARQMSVQAGLFGRVA
jgi:DNA modification methylase